MGRRRSRIALFLLSCGSAEALDPSRKLWHYGYSQWQDRDGLPQNTVQAIAQTIDGYLWLGTEAGLVRFNGRTFQTFDTSNEISLRSNSVTALAAPGWCPLDRHPQRTPPPPTQIQTHGRPS